MLGETKTIKTLGTLQPTQITIPGSKSITNRALILAAQTCAQTTLAGALWSEDTQLMTQALQKIGIPITVASDPEEPSNRTLHIDGTGRSAPNTGTPEHPLEIYVGNSGTTARFLLPLLCRRGGCYRLDGTAQMRNRPQMPLFQALRQLGYTILAPKDGYLPATIIAQKQPAAPSCHIQNTQSSQYTSALLLTAPHANWQIHTTPADLADPYIQMTRRIIDTFPKNGGTYTIEPDASSASYFHAANTWAANFPAQKPITIRHWTSSNLQIDARFPGYLPLPHAISRRTDLGDSILTAMILAPQAAHPVTFTHLEHLRLQECDRLAAMRTELTRCGARVEQNADTLTIYPSKLHSAEIETYNDHRIAMSFAILGLGIPGITIKNPACVGKTFPNFFDKVELLYK